MARDASTFLSSFQAPGLHRPPRELRAEADVASARIPAHYLFTGRDLVLSPAKHYIQVVLAMWTQLYSRCLHKEKHGTHPAT